MSAKARAYFYRQMATLLDAGIPIRSVLSTLGEQTSGPLRRATLQLGQCVDRGQSLAEGLADRSQFTLLETEMLCAGEQSGRLSTNAGLLAELFEYRSKVTGQLIASLAYPAALLHLALLLIALPTMFSANLQAFGRQLGSSLVVLYGLALAGYLGYRLATGWQPLGRLCEALLLHTPILGGIHRKTISARFSRSLSGLYQAGLPIAQAVEISLRSSSSPSLALRLGPGVDRLRSGAGLTEVLTDCGFFGTPLLSMVRTGETSGTLELTLEKSAEHAQQEARNALTVLLTLLPVLVFLVVAAFVAYHVISAWSGYFSKLPI